MQSFVVLGAFLVGAVLLNTSNVQGRHKELYMYTVARENWFDALRYCHLYDFELVSLTTHEEYVQLLTMLKEIKWDHENIWIAGTDLGSEGNFTWISTGKPFENLEWAPGQPDNHDGNENCVHMSNYNPGANMTWNDADCMQKMRFVCEAFIED